MSKPGKSMADDILAGVTTVTKAWTKQRKAEERHASARWRRAHVPRTRYATGKASVRFSARKVSELPQRLWRVLKRFGARRGLFWQREARRSAAGDGKPISHTFAR
jgi:hypothetical protein